MLIAISDFFYKIIHWETWHYHAKYIPLLPSWVWYCIKSRSVWFFTASNPELTFGGMEGESKEEMYSRLPPETYPKSIFISPSLSLSQLETEIAANDFKYPFVVKPNVGMMGFMFRKINNAADLTLYHKTIPIAYVVQDLIDYPVEVSVFYYRHPDEKKGTVSGFLRKESPEVTGDGKSTLRDLIESFPGVRFKQEEMLSRHRKKLKRIIPAGEKFILSNASNRSQGGKIIGLQHEIDDNFTKIFDDISHYSGSWYYGRYDIKCASVDDLKKGINFSILEYNGCGSGIQHVYGNGYSLFEAFSIILHHWKMLYKISKANNKKGVSYWKFITGLQFLRKAKKNLNMLKKLDREFPAFS